MRGKTRLKHFAVAALCCLSANAWALSTSANLTVSVQLQGICVSTSLSQKTQALVKVICQNGQFVSIETQAGRPFVGKHGGAYRFSFSKAAMASAGFLGGGNSLEDWVGQGTITALRVLNLTETDERLELLVSF